MKRDKIFKGVFILLLITYLALFFTNAAGYYEYKNYDKNKRCKRRSPADASIRHSTECRHGLASKHRRTSSVAPDGAQADGHRIAYSIARGL